MVDREQGGAWRGERSALLAEVEEYNRLYDGGAFDDDDEWNAWIERHPRFTAYWDWQSEIDDRDRNAALARGDEYLLDLYFDGPPPPTVARRGPRPLATANVALPISASTEPDHVEAPLPPPRKRGIGAILGAILTFVLLCLAFATVANLIGLMLGLGLSPTYGRVSTIIACGLALWLSVRWYRR